MKVIKNLKIILKKALNLIYPLNCVICKKSLNFDDSSYLCPNCHHKIIKNKPPFCIKCGCSLGKKRTASDYICLGCQNKQFYFERVWTVNRYMGIIRQLIHLFKYHRQQYLTRILGKLMVDFIKVNLNYQTVDVLVPVPLHIHKLRQREFNQSNLLAKEINQQISIPIDNSLIRIKRTSSQTGLSEQERFRNIAGAFKIKKGKEIAQKSVLLVDDVLTSGATANECARVLKQGGAKRVEILALAGK